jgi:hypothetical protein
MAPRIIQPLAQVQCELSIKAGARGFMVLLHMAKPIGLLIHPPQHLGTTSFMIMGLRPAAKVGKRRLKVARFMTTAAFYADAVGVGRVRAGKTVADSANATLPGDIVWTGLNSNSLPAGFTPLDAAATSMRAASRWANTPVANVCLGADSVDG